MCTIVTLHLQGLPGQTTTAELIRVEDKCAIVRGYTGGAVQPQHWRAAWHKLGFLALVTRGPAAIEGGRMIQPHIAACEDGSTLIEWILEDARFYISIESDRASSSWGYVTKVGVAVCDVLPVAFWTTLLKDST